MCGIAGVIGTLDPALIQVLAAALDPRGPDGRSYGRSGTAHIGATRLSIMDPAAGVDLIWNESGTMCVAFNGEIYNHRTLRAQLQSRGHRFRTHTDTEVIVHLYEDAGEECVRYLHGMFAFAILDEAKVFLARDRLGIKPLYYTYIRDSHMFVFASEIKAILRCPAFRPSLDMQAFADFVVLSHPVGTDTFIQDLKSLAAGHTMTVSHGDGVIQAGEQKSYYCRPSVRSEAVTFDSAQQTLGDALRRAVESHLAADVPVGLTLSGGIDSSVLALFARELVDGPLLTFTVSDYDQHPDLLQAAAVANIVRSEHHPFVMTFEEYLDAIPGYIAAEERPSRMYGLPFFLLCRKIKHHVRACLHGEGADEVFGGYDDYLDPTSRARYVARRLPLLKQLGVAPSERLTAILERLFGPACDEDTLQATFDINLADPLQRHHLDPVDKCSMAAGIEIRLPYLDDGVVELVAQFPLRFLVRRDLGVRKYLLRHLCLERFGPRVRDIVLRGKLGVPSAGIRFMKRLDDICERTLPSQYLSGHPLGYCFESKRQLVAFELFEEIFLKNRGRADADGGILDFLNRRSGQATSRFAALANLNRSGL